MRTLTCAAALCSLFVLTACSEGAPQAPAPEAKPQLQPGATLMGSVGTEDDPEAYEIRLETESGEPVTALAAGRYTLRVADPSKTHNFHLTGAGVNVATDVGGTGTETFEVTFSPGEYSYVCDPHPSMSGGLRAV